MRSEHDDLVGETSREILKQVQDDRLRGLAELVSAPLMQSGHDGLVGETSREILKQVQDDNQKVLLNSFQHPSCKATMMSLRVKHPVRS